VAGWVHTGPRTLGFEESQQSDPIWLRELPSEQTIPVGPA
jgi:hypothetical protein